MHRILINCKAILIVLVIIFSGSKSRGQITIPRISFNKTALPDTTVFRPTTELYLDPALPDVKAIGRGMTSVTGWNGYLGMLNNPAYLSNENFAFELADAQVTIPQTTIDAIAYLNANQEDLKEGRFFRQLEQGIYDLRYFNDVEKQQEALSSIYDASKFGDDVLTNVIGDTENPTMHGFLAFPNFKFQYKNFGISLYNVTQASFLVTSGSILNTIRDIHRLQDEEFDQDAFIRLTGIIYNAFNQEDILRSDVLPIIYSVAASNTALSFGYGKNVNEKLSLGANIHFYRRALSVGIIEAADYNQMLDIATKGLDDPIYDINLTVGLNYLQSKNLSFGMVASNILPSRKIESQTKIKTFESELDYEIIGESWMDSVAINLYDQRSEIVYPYSLSIPFILSTGTTWIPVSNLYISAEWADMLANDNIRYRSYTERFRLGAEYSFLKEIVSFRIGMANLKPTIGGGISIPLWDFNIDLDVAYAHTKITNTAATYLQLKIRYRHKKKD